MSLTPTKGNAFQRQTLSLSGGAVVALFGFLGFYFLPLPLIGLFGWDEWTAPTIPLIVAFVATVAIGAVVGWFLFPLLLRPFITPAVFWNWVGNEFQVKIPGLDPVFDRWARFLYPRQ